MAYSAEVQKRYRKSASYRKLKAKHAKLYYQRHRTSIRLRARNQVLMKKYGINITEFNDLLLKQGRCCGICHESIDESIRQFHVDHDHITGKIRGILCGPCNMALGIFRDSKEVVSAALDYLQGKN